MLWWPYGFETNFWKSCSFQYEAYVSENTVGEKVMDIGVVDKDSPGTPAWHATFNIIKGNEDGAFKIVKSPDSNIGTLCVEKVITFHGFSISNWI